ncbi:MAG: oligosaccharide flippase family protein [Gammaproteobacteria bacterium]
MSVPNAPRRFRTNVLWSWATAGANIALAIFLAPLMIQKLGDEAYGIWALLFSLVEYYVLLDLGFRSAIVKHVAHYWSLGQPREVNRVINTGLVYFAIVAVLLCVATITFAPFANRVFAVSANYQTDFVYMALITGCAWAVGLFFICFSSCLEAVQRFDLSSRALLVANVSRVLAILGLLLTGFGLRAVVTAAVAARIVQFVLVFLSFRKVFVQWRYAWRDADWGVFRKLFSFSSATVPSNLAWVFLLQGPTLIIGHVLSATFAGYYSFPGRLTQAVQDLVYRLGGVTTARAAELAAHKDWVRIMQLAIQTNGYGLLIFSPAAIFLLAYGQPLFRLLLSPQYALVSAPLLPYFLAGVFFSDAGQFNSSSILFGIAKHRLYSLLLLTEALLAIAGIYYFASRSNLVGATATCSVLMILNRGIATPWLLCRATRFPFFRFLYAIYARPMGVGIPILVGMVVLQKTLLPGTTILQLVIAGIATVMTFGALAARICLSSEHRQQLVTLVAMRVPRFEDMARLILSSPRGHRTNH